MQSPKLYATFLLWLLSELFEALPEVGDPEKPKLVFFFDEAHLLFDDAPKALLDKIEQVVRLIRSKGVGVYFITQNPIDIPEKSPASSATGSSTPCAPSPRATRRRSRRRPRPSASTPTSMSKPRSPS
jgi:DNA helicase HerA-like ATPase